MRVRRAEVVAALMVASVGSARAQVDISRRADELERAGRYEAAASLLSDAGEWEESARMWLLAVRRDERLASVAAQTLRRVPSERRDGVLRAVFVGQEWDPQVNRFGAELLLAWDRPNEAWSMLDASLPEDPSHAYEVLWRFADRSGRLGTPAALRVRGYALERMAELSRDPRAVARLRFEAARAFAEAGELLSAERMLQRLPRSGLGDAPGNARSMAALIRVLAESNRVEEAERRFDEWESRLGPDLGKELKIRIAEAWVREAELDRAERLLGEDSTVGAQSVRGWIALYRGDLSSAVVHFRAAGPDATTREEATRRATMLVFLDRLAMERSERIGEALLALRRGDTLRAVTGLEEAARSAPSVGARQSLLVLTGELAVASERYERAVAALVPAVEVDSAGPVVPAALLALARAYVGLGRRDEAVAWLERLILSHPESALVPGARRMLNELLGSVPEP